jgi:hypothetical protein
MMRHIGFPIAVTAVALCFASTAPIGIFSEQGSVGQTPAGTRAGYDRATGEYQITGGGANIWSTVDGFYYVWKQMSGDMSLSADVRFVGTSAAQHRKAVLMIRQDLSPAAPYADAAYHGNGLTALQYRLSGGAETAHIPMQVDGPARIRIERHGNRFTMYAGAPDQELKPYGPVTVKLHDPVYVGLGVCSHVATTLETAIFSKVKLEATASN